MNKLWCGYCGSWIICIVKDFLDYKDSAFTKHIHQCEIRMLDKYYGGLSGDAAI